MHRRLFLVLLFLGFCPFIGLAQSNTVSAGSTLTGGGRKLSYSVGQVFYQVKSASEGRIREGLQQIVVPPTTAYFHTIPTFLGSSGTSFTGSQRKISYTVGQPFYILKTGVGGKVRDGIQQPLLSPVMLNINLYIEGFYQGGGLLAEVLGGGISDTIKVELHDPMSPSSIVYSADALLNIWGGSHVNIPPSLRGEYYYVVIRHRNSIETWSKLPIHMTTLSLLNFATN